MIHINGNEASIIKMWKTKKCHITDLVLCRLRKEQKQDLLKKKVVKSINTENTD